MRGLDVIAQRFSELQGGAFTHNLAEQMERGSKVRRELSWVSTSPDLHCPRAGGVKRSAAVVRVPRSVGGIDSNSCKNWKLTEVLSCRDGISMH